MSTALGFVAGLPRRALVAIGLLGPRSGRRRPGDAGGRDAALSRLGATEELIDRRFGEMREWQTRLLGEHSAHLTDLAERMDFLERVLVQQVPEQRLKPGNRKASTPV